MKAHIITIHHITNFGSVFQAAALCQYLNDSGVETDIIDYRPAYYDAGRNKLKTVIGRLINYKAFNVRRKKYDDFIIKNQKLSKKRYTDKVQLKELDNIQDLFIAGGDQLWNTHHPSGRDSAYKLDFVSKGRKVAYGTSIGRDNLSVEEWNQLGNDVKDFSYIGLREQSTVSGMRSVTDTCVEHVLDPVALYDKTWYEQKYIQDRPIEKKYAVVYLIKPSSLLDETISRLRSLGYFIVQVSGFTSKSNVDILLKDSGPDEILNYIYHADFVLSGSFHATLFSILFNKQFATLLPELNTNARIENLVQMVNLESRIVHDNTTLESISETIKYGTANQIIEEERVKSKAFLRKMLENA